MGAVAGLGIGATINKMSHSPDPVETGGRSHIALIIGGAIALIIIIAIIIMTSINSISQVTRSTVRREPLPRNSANDSTPLFTDHLGWIGN